MTDTLAALRELNDHPDTTFTVLTGEGRFFSSGADVSSEYRSPQLPVPSSVLRREAAAQLLDDGMSF